jgi:hypothetical protein
VAAMAAPIHAIFMARLRRRAPMLVPTMAATGASSLNTSGTSRYSSRTPVPYPAAAAGPTLPASPVEFAAVHLWKR